MKAGFHKLVYWTYSLARIVVRATGMRRALRRSIGPLAGRFVFASSPNSGKPAVIQGHQMFLAPPGRYPSPDMVVDRYEPATTMLFKQYLKPGMVAVDVGANVGYFTLLAAGLVGPTGRVYAIEPEPQNNALLRQNVNLNSYSNVTVKEKAVSNISGATALYLSALDNGSHSIHDAAARGVKGTLMVATTTLDDMLEQEGWPNVDLVKIDVEGAEMMVLEGMELLSQKSPSVKLVLEYCPFLIQAAGVNPSDLLDKLESMKFQIQFVDEDSGKLQPRTENAASITARLLKQETYMNIVCARK